MLLVILLRTSLKSNLLTLTQYLVPLADMCIMHVTVQASETATEIPTQNENMEGNWVPVCKPEEVPKGELRPVQCSSSNSEYVTEKNRPSRTSHDTCGNSAGLGLMAGSHLEPLQAWGIACNCPMSCLAYRISV